MGRVGVDIIVGMDVEVSGVGTSMFIFVGVGVESRVDIIESLVRVENEWKCNLRCRRVVSFQNNIMRQAFPFVASDVIKF